MAKKLTKTQKIQVRQTRKERGVRKKVKQDSIGISRKKRKISISAKTFITLKIISIVAIPVCYILYSTLLLLCAAFSASMFIFAILAENRLNHTFIKSNHVKILKFDSIIAIILIIIVIVSVPVSLNSSKKMPFGRGNTLKYQIENIGSCLTGGRSLLKLSGYGMKFAMKEFPADMPKPDFSGGDMPDNMPPFEFNGELPDFSGGFPARFDKKDILMNMPVDSIFSQLLSSINTVIIFLIPITSLITLLIFVKNKDKHKEDIDELKLDELPNLDEMDLDKIFMFGYEEIK